MQLAILTASVLLLLGFALRARLRILQLLYVPASVVGGLLGLAVIQWAAGRPALREPVAEIAGHLHGWPVTLIAVVFAGLLLERPERRLAESVRGAALAGIYAWIVILGQVVLGLAATWLLIQPLRDVPPAFGQLMEAGFAGGHGTATALGDIYEKLVGFPAGRDLGLFVATVGLIYSVVSGIVLVNVAVRRGWTRSGEAQVKLISGLEQRHDPSPAAFARVRGEVIDPLAFQVLLVALAFLVGLGLQWGFRHVAAPLAPEEALPYLERLPLFLFTLLGGWIVRWGLTVLALDDLLDGASIKRIVAIAMEFLIVAAIASLRIEVVAAYFWPVSLLCVLGFAWTAVCLLVLARRLLPAGYWFELGIINYGMSTGTTAQGIMLLRIVDRDLDSGAAEDYALAAPLSAPFIGGGVITMSLPLVLTKVATPVVVAVAVVAMVGLFMAGRHLRRAVAKT